jgi:hypothetical protein
MRKLDGLISVQLPTNDHDAYQVAIHSLAWILHRDNAYLRRREALIEPICEEKEVFD